MLPCGWKTKVSDIFNCEREVPTYVAVNVRYVVSVTYTSCSLVLVSGSSVVVRVVVPDGTVEGGR